VFLLRGTLTDLYDFDLDAEFPSPDAAMVQAGYNGIGRLGGHVFKIEVAFSGTTAVPHDYVYRTIP
jgi:hypothetical protein